MLAHFVEYIYLIIIILVLVMLANKLKIAYPIVLVLGGLLLSFVSTFSHITIDPDVVFLIFLPPLLYEAAWQTSWKDFYKWRRVIMAFAFPVVIITATVIAITSSSLIPGFTLAMGFLLGGIISPPDAVSATTIMRQVKAPKSLVSIIEGESLLNDASSLIIVQFAVIAVTTGRFDFGDAAGRFVLVVIMGIVIGLTIGMLFYAIHRLLPTTTSIDIVLTLVTPYCMYFLAEHFEFSGVLAVVSGGLLLSNKRRKMFNYRTRVESVNVWTNFVFVLNGLVFLLIGLQLPTITSELTEIGLRTAIKYGVIISVILIITRLLCAFGASLFTTIAGRYIRVADRYPGWRSPLVAGWAGMRGVVSLAAALSVPLMSGERPFPHRSLILFITFIVILVTLVFQGLTLPWLIRKLKIKDKFAVVPETQQALMIKERVTRASLELLQERFSGSLASDQQLKNLADKLQIDLQQIEKDPQPGTDMTQFNFTQAYLDVLEKQRYVLNEFIRDENFTEEIIRRFHSIIDLEEYRVREALMHHNDAE